MELLPLSWGLASLPGTSKFFCHIEITKLEELTVTAIRMGRWGEGAGAVSDSGAAGCQAVSSMGALSCVLEETMQKTPDR